jgi:ATP-dependent DNA helicase PIF1
LDWQAEYGTIQARIFSVTFTAAIARNARVLKKSELSCDALTRIRALPKLFKGWLYPAPQYKAEYAESATDLPNSMLASALSAVVTEVQRWTPDSAKPDDAAVGLRQLLSDPRILDQDKLSLLVLPWMVRHHSLFAATLDHGLYRPLRGALRIDEQWLDIDQNLPQETRALSEWLLEPSEFMDLRSRRERALEERRRREEQERLRQEEERERVRLEKERQEQIRADRTEALRSALAAGRGQADPSELVVTEEFQNVFAKVEAGEKLLFVTGKPGTGKSTLVQALKRRLSSWNIAVLSFTGPAALNVSGQTINSFFAMPPQLMTHGWKNEYWSFKQKAQALELLVIDEVSMLRPDMLDAMDTALKHSRGDGRPFGGVQVVLVGDLFQLPPVIENQPAVQTYYARTYGGQRYFTASLAFREKKPLLLELTRVFRQKQASFLEFLSKIREASISGDELDVFNVAARRRPDFEANEFHLIVTPRRAVAAAFNKVQLDQIPSKPSIYKARFESEATRDAPPRSDSSNKYPADIELELKTGAQVVFVKNDDGKHWVNGDLGIVEDLADDWIRVTTWSGTWRVERVAWPLIRYEIDRDTHRLIPFEYGKFVQFPLRLAWASTIHKMQGQTVDRIRIDLTGGAFETGMTYVALSRCRTSEGIRLTRPLLKADVLIDSTIIEHLAALPRA